MRRALRARETVFVLLAALIGAAAGALTVAVSTLAHLVQAALFHLAPAERLSAMPDLTLLQLCVLPLGGAVLALFTHVSGARSLPLVDAVEANALHGGRMSKRDSAVISTQTVLSNGFGASVGLEAAYAQLGGCAGSVGGRLLALRRADYRTLVGAGAGAGIAAAFGAPLVGAFYAFEIVIGAYTPAAIAPVAAAALSAALVSRALGGEPYLYAAERAGDVATPDYLLFALLGAVAAVVGIVLMRAVSRVEAASRRSILPRWSRPIVGGLLLMPIAALSPQALSAGHGALHLDIAAGASLGLVATVFLAKSAASIVSLGFGFRGGLFFASLFLGTLLGHLFAGLAELVAGFPVIDGADAAVVGMGALAVAVIGGPMTMAMLVLEMTQDFALTGAVLLASLVASVIVRENFGYSFSTWRLHLRGETIKSARDVGWVKTLTAGRMMRKDARSTPGETTIAEFRRKFPLGSTSRVIVTKADGTYLGIVATPAAYDEGAPADKAVGELAAARDHALRPADDIASVMARFDAAGTDELAVVGEDGAVLGLLSETFVRKRYAQELEKAQRELFGER
ncbi:chloride channel protein [Aurantimonas sp. Leaf443]|nr:chloride channel protein [Aurantimonas sp. Leaf443]